ncbi:MAG: hypothetical protein ABEI98_10420 [Halorhabdus sp.]
MNSGAFATTAKLTVGALAAVVGNSLGGTFGASLGSGAVQAVVAKVINYVRQNGFTQSAFDACVQMGLCP